MNNKKTISRIFNKKNNRSFIIAEVSANHGQNFTNAVSLIREAKKCGADAVKFQAYTPDTLTIDSEKKYFKVIHPQWKGQNLYKLYSKAYMPWSWFEKLKRIADSEGIVFFATSFDKTSVDLLENLAVSIHKISSFEIVDLQLIEYIARTKKPLILSTGMATFNEIKEAVSVAKKAGAKNIALLKCVSSYPASVKSMNLKTIKHMKEKFKLSVGLSDHSLGIGVSIAAVSIGAQIIEKHFTLTRKLKTPDSFFSLEPKEFKDLVDNIRIAENAIGNVYYGLTKSEKDSRVFRRSIFAIADIKKGEKFADKNIKAIRAADGLKPKYMKNFLGKIAKTNVKKGTPVKLGFIR